MDGLRSSCVIRCTMISGLLLCVFAAVGCSPDHGLAPTVQGIRGKVRFGGTWPDSILEVRVAVFETYPVESFLDLSGYSDSIPLGSDSCFYEVSLPPGEYGIVAVVCRQSASWDATCLLGFYYDGGSDETPQAITVRSGAFVEGIDISVDIDGRHAASRIRIPMAVDWKGPGGSE